MTNKFQFSVGAQLRMSEGKRGGKAERAADKRFRDALGAASEAADLELMSANKM